MGRHARSADCFALIRRSVWRLTTVPAHTLAQAPQQNALARTLFEEGVALADRGDYVGAADRFSRAYSLKPTSGIAFNWASVSIETGKLVQAGETCC